MMCSPGLPQGAGTARGPQAVGQECAATPRAHLEKQDRKATGAGRRVFRDVGCPDAPHAAAAACACRTTDQRERAGRSLPGAQAEVARRFTPERQVFPRRRAPRVTAGWIGRPVLDVAPNPHSQGSDPQGFVKGRQRELASHMRRAAEVLSCGRGGEGMPSRVAQRRRQERIEGSARMKDGTVLVYYKVAFCTSTLAFCVWLAMAASMIRRHGRTWRLGL